MSRLNSLEATNHLSLGLTFDNQFPESEDDEIPFSNPESPTEERIAGDEDIEHKRGSGSEPKMEVEDVPPDLDTDFTKWDDHSESNSNILKTSKESEVKSEMDTNILICEEKLLEKSKYKLDFVGHDIPSTGKVKNQHLYHTSQQKGKESSPMTRFTLPWTFGNTPQNGNEQKSDMSQMTVDSAKQPGLPLSDNLDLNIWKHGDYRKSINSHAPLLKLRAKDNGSVFKDDPTRWQLTEQDLVGSVTMGDGPAVTRKTPSSQIKEQKKFKSKCNLYSYLKRTCGIHECTNSLCSLEKSAYTFTTPLTKLVKMAADAGYDPVALMECADNLDMELYFPCMQCCERQGYMRGYSDGDDDSFPKTSFSQKPTDGRCPTCGGQVMTVSSYGKMFRAIRNKIKSLDLVARDVFPDGNCQLSSIIHQLRMAGEFGYTPSSLRLLAVEYLRNNPKAEDGTHLVHFLTDGETWEAYLKRMSTDGEWGDHMILTAIANIVQKRITIFGGMTGNGETIILPKQLKQPTASSKSLGQDRDSSDEDKMGSIILGHLGESHYISFCSRDWQEKLIEKMKQHATNNSQQDKPVSQHKIPLLHINCLVAQVLRLEYIRSQPLESVFTLEGCIEGFKSYVVGSLVNQLQPQFAVIQSFLPDIANFLPTQKNTRNKPKLYVMFTPTDTKVVLRRANAQKKDLILKESVSTGFYWCVPKVKKLWPGHIIESSSGQSCLKTSHTGKDDSEFCHFIAFQCEFPNAFNEWKARERKAGWPDKQSIEEIVSLGCHAVPIESLKDDNDIVDEFIPESATEEMSHLWMISFASVEKQLFNLVSEEQMQCFRLFQHLVSLMTKELKLPRAILQSIFFLACENIEQTLWKSSPGECLLILLKNLASGLRQKRISHHIVMSRNLLGRMPQTLLLELLARIEVLQNQTLISIYMMLEESNLTNTEIGLYMDEIIGDSFMFAKHGDAERSFREAIIPATYMLVQILVLQDEFTIAANAVRTLHDLSVQHTKQHLSITAIVQEALVTLPIYYYWMISVVLDIMCQTSITNNVLQGFHCVHISELFGPDIDEDLPNVVVPEVFSIHTGNLFFAVKSFAVLQQAIGRNIFIKCLTFYLKTYNSLAGDLLVIQQGQDTSTQYFLKQLLNLHTCLFNSLQEVGRIEEFRSFFARFKQLAAAEPSGFYDKNVKAMKLALGEDKTVSDQDFTVTVSQLESMLTAYEDDMDLD